MNEKNDTKQNLNESKKELIAKLNECGRKWTPIKCSLEKAKLLKDQTWLPKWIEICTLATQIFGLIEISEQGTLTPASADEITNEAVWRILMIDIPKNFDPTKCNHERYDYASLYAFIKSRIRYREMDILQKEYGSYIKDKEEKDVQRKQETGHFSYKIESLSAPLDEEGDLSIEDICSSNKDEYKDSEESEYAADIFRQIALILSINSKRGKKMKYYRTSYTSDIISYEKEWNVGMYRFQHEREIDSELNREFVDYCMEGSCQGIRDIYYGNLKRYGEVVKNIGRHEAEELLPIPIENKVAAAFLEISESYYSKCHDRYLKLIEKIKNR